jgi:hypothetical protein
MKSLYCKTPGIARLQLQEATHLKELRPCAHIVQWLGSNLDQTNTRVARIYTP